MATRVASILAEIGLDSSKFTSGADGLNSGLAGIVSGFLSVTAVAAAAGRIMLEVVDQMKAAEQAAVDSAVADAKLEAVLRSTGGEAGITAGQLNGLADQISRTAGLDDELVKSSEAVLLTFRQIGNDVFPQTMQAAADMAAVMGGDLQGTIIQVGKAMNDFSGYTALKRAGVSFTEEQIKQIAYFKDTNDLAGYQKLVLSELSKEFGGAAQSMNEAGDGAANMAVSIENLQEALGAGLLPQQREFNRMVTETADTMTSAITNQTRWNDRMRESGVEIGHFNTYMKDGVSITTEQAYALASNAQVAENMSNNYRLMGEAILGVGSSAKESDEALQALSKTNQDMIQMTASFSSTEESYQKTNNALTKQRTELEEERAKKLKQGYSESGTAISGLDKKLADNAAKAKENAAAHEEANHRIMLSYLEQQLAIDGLTKDETSFLLDKGTEWGVYSKTAVDEMKKAMEQADKLIAKIGSIPTNKTVTINVRVNSSGDTVTGWNADLISGLGHANGADFIVPPGYPNDSYPMRVQSGEHVKVTPAGETDNSGGGNVFYGPVNFIVKNEKNMSEIMNSFSRM